MMGEGAGGHRRRGALGRRGTWPLPDPVEWGGAPGRRQGAAFVGVEGSGEGRRWGRGTVAPIQIQRGSGVWVREWARVCGVWG